VAISADELKYGLMSFETDIRLIRESDRESMESHFHLWLHDEVSQHADAILERLEDGSMPCDGEWPEAQIERFRDWVKDGKQP
jgi:hypothetical protein